MIDQSTIAAILTTARVRFISALVVVALLLGIVAEYLSITTAFYNLLKARCDAAISAVTALSNGSVPGKSYGNRQQDFLRDCLD